MKRMHIHIGVDNIEHSIRFYNALFDSQPVKVKQDYAKWLLEDPKVNFAISTRSAKKGVDHLGLQVDDSVELEQMRSRLQQADMTMFDQGDTVCCYARSDKSWLEDPSGIAWEAYHTMEDAELYSPQDSASACCTPETKGQPNCCAPSEQTKGCCG